jgi:hypothetical protein
MKLTKKNILAVPCLCEDGLAVFKSLDLPEVFTAREAAGAYLAAGGKVNEIAHTYGRMVAAGILPDNGAIWRIARLAFLVQSKASGLRAWAENLGPENWKEAHAAARAVHEAARNARARYAREAAFYAGHESVTITTRCAISAAAKAAGEAQQPRILEIIFQAIGE